MSEGSEVTAAADLWLGMQVRDLRKTNRLSLQQLGLKSGLSVGLLSQIERGLTSPSIRSLRQISEALGVTPARFFHQESPPPPEEVGRIVRKGKGRRLQLTTNGVAKWLLTPDLSGELEMLLVEIQPGGRSGDELYTHRGQECGFVVSGAMRLWVEAQSYLLQEGDSFRFRSNIPHRFENAADMVSIVLWIITPPLY
jgi:transcriptional regulator with XRE-family HTH domain